MAVKAGCLHLPTAYCLLSSVLHLLDEAAHEFGALSSGRGLDAATHVHGVGADGGNCRGDVVWIEAAREAEPWDAFARADDEGPVEGVPRPAARAVNVCIEEDGVGLVSGDCLGVEVRADPGCLDR